MSSIYLYAGQGTDPFCVQKTIESFNAYLGTPNPQLIPINDPSYITDREWFKSVKAVVIPGGNAAIIRLALGEGGEKIHEFVNQGGSYVGFCAGTYLATSFLYKYSRDIPHELFSYNLITPRIASLRGPLFSEFDATGRQVPYSEKTGRVVPLEGDAGENEYYVYWNGGGCFERSDPMVQTPLASYHGREGYAAVADYHKKGAVVLSNVHPEICLNESELQGMPRITEEERKSYLASLPQQKKLFNDLCFTAHIMPQHETPPPPQSHESG